MSTRLLLTLLLLSVAAATYAQDDLPLISEYTDGFAREDGLLSVYWDDDEGRVYLEIPETQEPLLYQTFLSGGLGSNDVGLDRGLPGPGRIVRFQRIGRRILLVEDNWSFRAESDNAAERRAVAEAFATSVIFGFELVARTDDRLLLDATPFVVEDAMGLIRTLASTEQGEFTLDPRRSGPNPTVLRALPQNVELEALLTLTSDDPGRFVRQVAPDPYAITLRLRHAFIKLPDNGYEPRPFDPRSGYYGISYVDFASPVAEPKERRFIARHRLEVQDGRVVKPIVYYLDPGVPEPIRSALLDGASWWAEGFEEAGLSGAFRVETLPEAADPLDVRFNIITWVHRATRGWSVGNTVIDPRTGEIIKGHVRLGSLRIRQDYLLAQGLLNSPDVGEDNARLQMALARIRQLSAHEVGHTLGIRHNFAASVSDRASVMDYPAPLARIDSTGSIDLSDAYAEGLGAWDKSVIAYGYGVFGANEEASLDSVLTAQREAGLLYISDEGARPEGGIHPSAHLWDNGADPLRALDLEMKVRRMALDQFGSEVLPRGVPLATMEEVFVPLYLRHRYQLEAVSKLLAGSYYEYAVTGEEADSIRRVPADVQFAALDAMLAAVRPPELAIPSSVRDIMPPRPPGFSETRELFAGNTGLSFDPYAPASALADRVFSLILNPERAARLVYQKLEDESFPGLNELIERTTVVLFQPPGEREGYERELWRQVQASWVYAQLRLARDSKVAAVGADIRSGLFSLLELLDDIEGGTERDARHREWLEDLIGGFLEDDFDADSVVPSTPLPPGSPIGSR